MTRKVSTSSDVEEAAWRGRENQFATVLLCATVAAAPLPYGSTDPSAISVVVAVLGLCLLCAKLRFRATEDWFVVAFLALITAGYTVVLHEQLSAGPWFGGRPDTAWRQLSSLLGDERARLSVVRDQPIFAVGNALACAGALLCAFLVCMNRQNADRLLKTIAWAGAAYAVYGIAAYLLAPEMVLWREKVLYRSVLSATFPNRNTAALYFGVCSVLWALRLARQLRQRRVFWNGRWRLVNLRWDLSFCSCCGGFLVCFLAMMLTGSRAGVAISIMGIFAATVFLLRRESLSRRAFLWLMLPVVAGGALSFLLIGGQVNERLGEHGLGGGGRWETYVSTWQIVSDHPLLGTGLGTFPFIFPRYRSADASIWGVWDRAHNTLLELAAEVGIPLTALVLLGWLLALLMLLRGSLQRRRGAIFPIAGLVCGAMAALHSMLDFSLQVPGLAVTIMALVGMGLAQRASRGGQALQLRPPGMHKG